MTGHDVREWRGRRYVRRGSRWVLTPAYVTCTCGHTDTAATTAQARRLHGDHVRRLRG